MHRQRHGSTTRARSSPKSDRIAPARSLAAAFLLTVALLAAGCGSDEGAETTAAESPPADATGSGAPADDSGGARPAIGDGSGGVALVEIGSFAAPLHLAQPPGVRDALYVVEQGGRIVRVAADGSTWFDSSMTALAQAAPPPPGDNCVEAYNPAQSDFDSDGEGDVCDLDDGMIYLVTTAPTFMGWQAENGFLSWNAYRGDLVVLRDTGVYTQEPGSNDLAWRWCGLPYCCATWSPLRTRWPKSVRKDARPQPTTTLLEALPAP